MRKLFTLVALLAMVLGANSKTVVDEEFSYSDLSDWKEKAGGFSSDEAITRLSLDDGCLHFKSNEATANFYDVQFQAFGIKKNFNPDAEYTIEFRIKGSVAQNIRAYFSGSNTPGDIALTTDWQTLTYKCKNNPDAQYFKDSGMLLFQCGDYIGEWWISNVKITHEEDDNLVEEYVELLTNGDAEKPWADPNVKWNDEAKNFTICAWGKVREENKNSDGGWDPFPATIEEESGNPSNHVFVVHAAQADSDGDAAAWDNQFWIEGPKAMKAGRKYKVSFRYKASIESSVQTQIHYQNPSSFKTGTGLGTISFTKDWQKYEDTFIATNDHAGGWSFAFNLNSQNVLATDFYFDDISWQEVKLEEGFFITTCDAAGSPDYNNVVKFKEDSGEYFTTIGTDEAPVSEIMISTVYGTPSAFKGGAIKPEKIDLGKAVDYKESNAAVIKLPGKGVWDINILPGEMRIEIFFVRGKLNEKITINANPAVITVDGVADCANTWDNQLFIQANRVLDAGEETYISFKYKASLDDAKTTTQVHKTPGAYIQSPAIDDVIFSTTEQTFEKTFIIPEQCAGQDMQTLVFNMAEIPDACSYTISDVIWKLANDTESLIDQTGTKNFFVKVGGGEAVQVGAETGINNVVVKKNNSTVKFNLAGQRVSNDYKGMVVDGNGNKYLAK